MRVVAIVHLYLPVHRAGSERMLHLMLRALQEARHDVHVVTAWQRTTGLVGGVYEVDGIPVHEADPRSAQDIAAGLFPDVFITHHDEASRTFALGHEFGVPVVFVGHNTHEPTRLAMYRNPHLVVFNSHWVREFFAWAPVPSIVVHPPVYAHEHRVELDHRDGADLITLVNLNRDKGADLFYTLAERIPHRRWLGVVGGHGEQVIRRDLPNVTIQESTGDMRGDVWSRTRLLLMPSIYESYGMAGVEAMCSGIPVIAHPTDGLRESLGPAGTFCDRDDLDAWVAAIEHLDDPETYATASARAEHRAAELDPAAEMAAFVTAVEQLHARRG